MRNVNRELRIIYVQLLQPVLTCPIYYGQAPDNGASLYVLITSQNSQSNNAITCEILNHAITLQIVSRESGSNSGASVDEVANDILNTIMPNVANTAVVTNEFEINSIQLVSDITTPVINDGVYKVITRNLIFSHNIKI